MKTKVKQSDLAAAMKAMRGLISKEKLSPFSWVSLDAAGSNVSLSGGSDIIHLTFRFPGETEEDGWFMVPGTYFDRFVGVLGSDVTISGSQGNTVNIADNQGMNFNVAAANLEQFIPCAGPADDAETFEIPAFTLREMILKVKHAVCFEDTRKVLNGIFVEIFGDKIEMTATDGRRLAHVEHVNDGGFGINPIFFTLPNQTVNLLLTLLKENGSVAITANNNSARIVADGWQIVSKLYAEKFPNWSAVVPKATEHRAVIRREAFINRLKAAALAFAPSQEHSVEISLRNDSVAFKAKSETTDSKIEMSGCKMPEGEKFKIHMNSDLLIDALDCLYDDEFIIEWNDAKSPIVLKCSIPWLAVIMPMMGR